MIEKHLLILGSGSVGKRHAKNFSNLNCKISAMDPREERLYEIGKETPLIGSYTTLQEALGGTEHFDGVIICSPPKFHMEQSIACLRKGTNVYLEKPLTPDLSSAEKLERLVEEANVHLLLGYTYRWWPPLQRLKDQLISKKIGRILHVDCTMSAHLADWHPWENYWDFFMASKELGGGALLDESHFVDLMLWFFGLPKKIYARVEKISSLKIETDDNVDAILVYPDGLRVKIHLDLFGRPHEKYIRITGENGSIHWSFDPNSLKYTNKMEQNWDEEIFEYKRNDMFINAAKEFLEILNGRQDYISCTAKDGADVMRVLNGMEQSTKNGCEIDLQ